MFVKVRDTQGNPLKYIDVRISFGNGTDDQAQDDRFTDLAGNTAWPDGLLPDLPDGANLYANTRNVQPEYKTATAHAPAKDALVEIVLEPTGIAPPPPPPSGGFTRPYGTDEEWHVYITNKLPQQLGLTVITRDALTAMRPHMVTAIPGAPAFWQNDVDGRTDYRPRVFLPTGDEDADRHGVGGRAYDIGNFPGDGPHTHFGDAWDKR